MPTMASLGHRLRSLASIMAFTVAISSCCMLAVAFYNLCSWSTTCKRSLDFSENNHNKNVLRIFKRTAKHGQRFHYYENCILATPSREDIHKLCAQQECTTVHCVRSCPCGDNRCHISSRATCFTRACMQFRVKVGQAENEASLERFSDIVNDYLSRLQDTNKIEVTCSDNNSHLFGKKLDLEISRDDLDACTSDGVTQPRNIKTAAAFHKPNRTKTDVYLVYFRLMSKWESFVKLPRLNSLIEHKRTDVLWNIHSFDNVQSQSFVLDENLREVLGLSGVASSTNKTVYTEEDDLLNMAAKDGVCVFFHVLACHESGIYSEIHETVQAGNTGKCVHQDKHRNTRANVDYNNHTFCDNNKIDMDMEDILYIYDRIGQIYSTAETNSFSLFVINIPDLKSTEAFDTAITGLVTRVLSQASNMLILMSDVGDPKFSRLDESVFLRTQIFNPLLHVFLSKATTLGNPAVSLLISELHMKVRTSTIGISSVHTLIQTMLSGKEEVKVKTKLDTFLTGNESTGNFGKEGTVTTVCPVNRINGPVECLCEGKHIRFPNDSIQVAFASYIVGNVNNKLLELSSLNNLRIDRMFSKDTNLKARRLLRNQFTCDRLYAVSVTNVNHVLWKRSTFILMTLHLKPTTRHYSQTVRLEAEVEYSADDSYNINFTINILHPTKIPLAVLSDSTNKNFKKLFSLLCQEPNDLIRDNPNRGHFLHAISAESNFGVKAKTKSLHHPCLYLLTRSYGESAILEVTNVCTDRSYHVTITIEYINILSLSAIPTEITVGAREVKYISSLVKNGYWVSMSGYRIKTVYVVTMI